MVQPSSSEHTPLVYLSDLSHTHTHTHTRTHRLTAFGPGLPGWAGTRINIQPLTPILIIGHPLSTCSIYYDPYKGKGSPYSITERRVPELIPVLGSQPEGDVSHKLGGRLSLLFRQACSYPRTP